MVLVGAGRFNVLPPVYYCQMSMSLWSWIGAICLVVLIHCGYVLWSWVLVQLCIVVLGTSALCIVVLDTIVIVLWSWIQSHYGLGSSCHVLWS